MSLATRFRYTSRLTAFHSPFPIFNAATLASLPRFRVVRSLLTAAADQPFPESRATSRDWNGEKPDDEAKGIIAAPVTRKENTAPRIRNVFYPPTVGQEAAVYSLDNTIVPTLETIRIPVEANEQARGIAQQAFTFIPEYNASTQSLDRQRLFISDLFVDSEGASVQVYNMSDNSIEVPANTRLGFLSVPNPKGSIIGDMSEQREEHLTLVKAKGIKTLPTSKIKRVCQAALRSQRHQDDKNTKSDRYHVSSGKRPNLWVMPLVELEESCENKAEAKFEEERLYSTDSLSISHRQERLRFREIHAEQIPAPLIWSKTTFMDYIEDLADSIVSRSLHRQIYTDGISHDETVARLLTRYLKDPSMSSYTSIQACNIALKFFYKHAMILRARSLFLYMEGTNMVLPNETFNIMLQGAAAQSNIYGFTHILRLMYRRKLVPDPGSWAALIMTVNSANAKDQILHSMSDRGLLENKNTKRFAVGLAVRGELVKHMNRGKSLVDFLDSMDKKYGSLWISVSACNNMLDEIAERGLMPEVHELLNIMSSRGLRPNVVTLNTLLGQYLRLQDLDLSIQILRYFEDTFRVRPSANKQGQVSLDTLFQTAWRRRKLNCCRVIWRHACLQATVSYRMQQLVTDSLLCSTPDIPQTRQEYWKRTAGKIIANIEKDDLDVGDHHLASRDVLTKLISWEKTGAARDLQQKLAGCIINRDLATARRHKAREILVNDLEKAKDLDDAWARDRVWKVKDVQWMLDHAVEIEIEPLQTERLVNICNVEYKGSEVQQ